MKSTHIILVCMLLMTSAGAMAQELRFSQSIFIEMEGSTSTTQTEVLDTEILIVPPNKTLKITSASIGYDYNGVPHVDWDSNQRIFINGKPLHYVSSANNTGYLPIWLPSGTYTLQLTGQDNSPLTLIRGFVSGVEFNLE